MCIHSFLITLPYPHTIRVVNTSTNIPGAFIMTISNIASLLTMSTSNLTIPNPPTIVTTMRVESLRVHGGLTRVQEEP